MSPLLLYVADGLDGTVVRIDSTTGRPMGPPLPAGAAPWQIVPGSDGSFLVLSLVPDGRGGVTHVARSTSDWRTQPVALERGAVATFLAGDDAGHAVVAFSAPGHPCHVALIDAHTGAVAPSYPACAGGEQIVGLALAARPAGITSYVAVWRRPVDEATCEQPTASRIVAIDMSTGAVAGVAPLGGVPGRLLLAPSDGSHSWLYAVMADPLTVPGGAAGESCPDMSYEEHYLAAPRWDLLALEPETLQVARAHPLRQPPRSLAVAPNGRHAYALVRRSTILHVDLVSGGARDLATLDEYALGLVATDDRLYAVSPDVGEVWAVERRTGRPLPSIDWGHRPIAIALGWPVR